MINGKIDLYQSLNAMLLSCRINVYSVWVVIWYIYLYIFVSRLCINLYLHYIVVLDARCNGYNKSLQQEHQK